MKKFNAIVLIVLIFTLAYAVKPASACGCNCTCPGVGTPGYWKNHPEAWPGGITVGGVYYTVDEAIALMNTPVKGDKTYTMFKAVVAAMLNWELGCDDNPTAESTLAEGKQWLIDFPVGSGVVASSEAWQYSHGEQIYLILDAYNNGKLCCPARD